MLCFVKSLVSDKSHRLWNSHICSVCFPKKNYEKAGKYSLANNGELSMQLAIYLLFIPSTFTCPTFNLRISLTRHNSVKMSTFFSFFTFYWKTLPYSNPVPFSQHIHLCFEVWVLQTQMFIINENKNEKYNNEECWNVMSSN